MVKMKKIIEQDVEDTTIEILKDLGYDYICGYNISPDSKFPERKTYQDIILKKRLLSALKKINPKANSRSLDEVVKKITQLKRCRDSSDIIKNNMIFHNYLIDGISISYRSKDGENRSQLIKLIDFDNIDNNEFLVVNQYTIIENNKNRRPDVIIFINGIPISVIELKNPGDESATIESAYNQIITYKEDIPSLFFFNELLVISDGTYAKVGTITSNRNWFLEWKSKDGINIDSFSTLQIETLLEGMFRKERLLDILKYFISYLKNKKKVNKILAGYHQYFAANKAIKKTTQAIDDNKKIGVVWHTQGSGKSLTLAFYTNKLQQNKKLHNPTIVVLTDRNDLDDQLFNTFSSFEILREKPIQANTKKDLKNKLKRSSGGIIFTTIQKFGSKKGTYETLSTRSNIIVAADEAHRTQYGFKAKINQDTGEIKYGLAKYLRDALPNASFIGFTGTPIDFEDKSTREVFGDYIDIYDINRAIEDKRTVRIYYESRIAPLKLNEKYEVHIDSDFEEVTEGEDEFRKEKLKTKWGALEAIVGSKSRLKIIAKDIVEHFSLRRQVFDGKALVVCMSRRICVDLYNEILKIRPEWGNKEDNKGFMKVIMTGSASDPIEFKEHVRDKRRRKELANIFKDPKSNFKLAIVRDMWLTGFDVPCLNTMYIDKPMKGHTLMQAIARVNRIYPNKEGGLIVDYLGVASDLKRAINNYSEEGGKGKPINYEKEAINLMLTKYDIVKSILHNFDYSKFFNDSSRERLKVIPQAIEFILKQENGKKRFVKQTIALLKAYSLVVTSKEAKKIRDEVAFFQAVKSAIVKSTSVDSKRSDYDINYALKQIVSKAIVSDSIVDVFNYSGIKKQEISILSDAFLEEVKNLKQKNLAFESLKKLLQDQIKTRFTKNIIKQKKFSELLKSAINRYSSKSITSTEVILELVELAKKIRSSKNRGQELGLNEEEEAFYDALIDDKSAVEIIGDELLKKMAHELSEIFKRNKFVDWKSRPDIHAKLKVLVKRLLKKYGYPPSGRASATKLIIDQAERIVE
jgi:type I restriction enzyme R subunit